MLFFKFKALLEKEYSSNSLAKPVSDVIKYYKACMNEGIYKINDSLLRKHVNFVIENYYFDT